MKQVLSIFTSKHFSLYSLFLVYFMVVPISALGQSESSLPQGEDSDLVSSKCTTCHALSTVLVKRASRDGWDETVSRMVTTYMAPINNSERNIIVDYLATNLGEGSSHNPGQQIVAEQCFKCHNDGMWLDLKTDRNGWLSVVYRMVGREVYGHRRR